MPQIIRTLDALQAKIAECNDALTHQSDDAMRALFSTFVFDFSAEAPADPFDPAYRAFQLRLHQALTGRPYELLNERTLFLVDNYEERPFPYYLQSPVTAGNHLLAIGFLLRAMSLRPGARILEFGPGWGSTTIALAQLGMKVTAVDIEPNFCEVIRRRAARHLVDIEVIEADFFWAEGVAEPYDAVVFFESFHHCDDHLRLLRALRRAVKPDGRLYLGSEPILIDYAVPWGIRTDGEALWAMRNFGWLELGFRESYLHAAFARTGWRARKQVCTDADWINVWTAHQVPPDETAVEQCPPAAPPPDAHEPAPPPAKLTAPIRGLRRLLRSI